MPSRHALRRPVRSVEIRNLIRISRGVNRGSLGLLGRPFFAVLGGSDWLRRLRDASDDDASRPGAWLRIAVAYGCTGGEPFARHQKHPRGHAMLVWQDYLIEWQDLAFEFVSERLHDTWLWFNALSREEWLIVMAVCCAIGFLFLKGWGQRGPC